MTPATRAADPDPDTIALAGKTIYLNPFLYWRRFNANTDRWLREPGQLSEELIRANRQRFYPRVAWEQLEPRERAVKDGAIEMFLKTLKLISTFYPDLSAGHLLEVERKMALTKKKGFERWVARSLRCRALEEQRQRRRFHRKRPPALPFAALLVMAAGMGWWLGAHRSCSPVLPDPGVTRASP